MAILEPESPARKAQALIFDPSFTQQDGFAENIALNPTAVT